MTVFISFGVTSALLKHEVSFLILPGLALMCNYCQLNWGYHKYHVIFGLRICQQCKSYCTKSVLDAQWMNSRFRNDGKYWSKRRHTWCYKETWDRPVSIDRIPWTVHGKNTTRKSTDNKHIMLHNIIIYSQFENWLLLINPLWYFKYNENIDIIRSHEHLWKLQVFMHV